MSNETNSGLPHERAKSIVSFKSSFWLAVIIVGLFVAALNFVQVMSKGEEGGEKKEATEQAKTELPNNESKSPAESAKTDASKTETPNAEAPKPEAPKKDAPAAEHK